MAQRLNGSAAQRLNGKIQKIIKSLRLYAFTLLRL
jgi:hypothetical protein